MKVLLAEDTRDLNRALTVMLEYQGYEVDAVFDGQEAVEHIDADSYDAMILDIMMPKKDGVEVIREVRSRKIVTPILLLTAKTQIDDKVSGLDAGADDYLTKPFATEELLARIRAMVRRHSDYSGQSYAYGDIQLDADQLELSCRNSVRLSIKEFELLRELIVGAGHSISTDFLIKRIWSREPGAHADTVWLYIAYLKRKLAAVNSKLQIEGEKHGSYMLK